MAPISKSVPLHEAGKACQDKHSAYVLWGPFISYKEN